MKKQKIIKYVKYLKSIGYSNLDIYHILKILGYDLNDLKEFLTKEDVKIIQKVIELRKVVNILEKQVNTIERKVHNRHELIQELLKKLGRNSERK